MNCSLHLIIQWPYLFRTQFEQSCILHTTMCPPNVGSLFRFTCNFAQFIEHGNNNLNFLFRLFWRRSLSTGPLSGILKNMNGFCKRLKPVLNFEFILWCFIRWMQASTSCMMSSLALNQSWGLPPTTGKCLERFCFFNSFSGKEVGGWQEEQDRPSAEAQVWQITTCLASRKSGSSFEYVISGLAEHHLLGDSQEPSLELSSLESNAIRWWNCDKSKDNQHKNTSDRLIYEFAFCG